MGRIIKIIIFLLNVSCIIVKGNQFHFTGISINDGLSSNEATCIYQDHRGFIWIGTKDGLNKYDGEKFVQYKYNLTDSTSLSNNYIWDIKEDKDNNLWIGTSSGLNRYVFEKDCFERFLLQHETPRKTVDINFVRSFATDKEGNFWIATEFGLKRLVVNNSSQYSFKSYYPGNIEEDPTIKSEWIIMAIEPGPDDHVWCGTWGKGLLKFHPRTGEFISYKSDPNDPGSINGNVVTALQTLPNGDLLIGTYSSGLNIYKISDDYFLNYNNTPRLKDLLDGVQGISSFLLDQNENLWIGTHKNLHVFDKSLEDKIFFRKGGQEEGLSKDLILDIHEDDAGIIWIASGSGGVDKYDPNRDKFLNFIVPLEDPYHYDYIKDFTEDEQGNLWVGTYGNGLIHCTKSGKIINRYNYPQLGTDTINAVTRGPKGSIWAATLKGISIIELYPGSSVTFNQGGIVKDGLRHPLVMDIEASADSMIWIVTPRGVQVIDPFHQKVIPYLLVDTLSLRVVMGIKKDQEGNMILYGRGGAAIIKPWVPSVKYVRHDPDDVLNGLCNSEVTSFTRDHLNRYWFGTKGGITVYDIDKNNYIHYFEKDGLASQKINNLIFSGRTIWAETRNAISSINTVTGEIENHYTSDGLQHDGGTIWVDERGKVFIAGIGNFTTFYPGNIDKNLKIPPLYITGLWINGVKATPANSSVLQQDISYTSKITLSHLQQVLRFTFSALNYTLPEKNQYKYKLQGFDTSWHHLGNRNELTLMNLEAGHYTLLIKGSNNDNVWNNSPARLELEVLPPWWKTWQAILAYMLFFLFLVWGYRFFSVKKERTIAEMKKVREVNLMKIHFFTNMSHELRTPLTLIAGPLQKILNQGNIDSNIKSRLILIYNNTLRLLGMVNQILDLRKLETKNFKLQLKDEEIMESITKLIQTFTYEAEDKSIQLNFHAKPAECIISVDMDIIEKITSNLLSNAINYTPSGGKVDVKVIYESSGTRGGISFKGIRKKDLEGILSIHVADTGEGIPEHEKKQIFDRFYRSYDINSLRQQGTGIGLNIVKEMTELHHGRVKIENNQPKGTVFIVQIPVLNTVTATDNELHFVYGSLDKESLYVPVSETVIEKDDESEYTFLVVEDNHELRNYLAGILSENGVKVLQAANGKEGLAKALDVIPDFIILDIMMPEMDGKELCRRLKNNNNTNHIPVILLTAKSLPESQQEGLDAGADDYIIKPFNEQLLKAKINSLLKNRKILQEKYRQQISREEKETVNLPVDTMHPVDEANKRFLNTIKTLVEERFDSEEFNTESLAKELNMSRRHLSRKFSGITGIMPSSYIREFRLQKAHEILMNDKHTTVIEVAYQTGFKNTSHFSRLYKEKFGKSPSDSKL